MTVSCCIVTNFPSLWCHINESLNALNHITSPTAGSLKRRKIVEKGFPHRYLPGGGRFFFSRHSYVPPILRMMCTLFFPSLPLACLSSQFCVHVCLCHITNESYTSKSHWLSLFLVLFTNNHDSAINQELVLHDTVLSSLSLMSFHRLHIHTIIYIIRDYIYLVSPCSAVASANGLRCCYMA